MKSINLPINELKPALTGLSKVVRKNATLPILTSIAVTRDEDGWVTITGTDLDSFATVRMEQPQQGEASVVVVPLQELSKLVKECGANDTIHIANGANNRAVVQYPIGNQTGEANIESFPFEEFPQIPRIEGETFDVDDGMRTGIIEALQCASEDETRYILRGAFLDVTQKTGHYVVGTDGRHLYSSNSFILPILESIVLPDVKFIGWKGFSDDGAWKMRTYRNESTTMVELNSRRWKFVTKCIDGNYPNWKQVVPKASDAVTTLKLSQEVTTVILKLIPKIPCHDETNQTIGLVIDGDKLAICGRGKDDENWTKVEFVGASVDGSPVTIFLNRDLLSKALKFGLGEISIIDPKLPITFLDGGRQMIVMPVRCEVAIAKNEPPQESSGNNDTKQEERKPMPRASSNGQNGHDSASTNTVEKPTFEKATSQIESVKLSIRSARDGLNELLDTLKQIQRDQKSSEREVQSVRATLEKLQSVRI